MRSRPLALAATLAFAAAPAVAPAADHLDSPSVEADGRLDINDIYAYQSPNDSDNTVLIMTVNPAAGMLSPTTLNPRGVYELNIDNDGDAVADVTYQFLFGRARGDRPQSVVALRNGRRVARGRTGQELNVAGGGTLTVDVFDDPFFFDLDGFNRFKDGEGGFDGTDFFAGFNVTAIVMEVPSDELTAEVEEGEEEEADTNVAIFGRTTVRGDQFDRMGRPGITTVLIPDGLKNDFNFDVPRNDPRQYADVIAGQMVDLFGVSRDYADGIAAILTPDLLTFDTSSSDGYLNGRRLEDDVIDITLPIISDGAVTTDMVDSNDRDFRDAFPYLATPNESDPEL